MQNRIFVKPAEGCVVINPGSGRAIAPEGGWVKSCQYIRRRINDGDLTLATPPTEPTTKSQKGKE